ncbi:MAG: PdaC/SigV domain-containing protein [Fidelibacterota bacterium]
MKNIKLMTVIPILLVLACSSQYADNQTLKFVKRQYKESFQLKNKKNKIDIDLYFYQLSDSSRIAVKINNNIKSAVFSKMGLLEETDSLNYQTYYNNIVDEYKELSETFPNSATIGFQQKTTSEITYNANNILSVYLESYTYTGGAHGMEYLEFLNFDTKSGNRIDILSKVSNKNKFVEVAEEKLRKKLNMDDDDPWPEYTFLKQFELPKNIGMTSKGYQLIYNPYEILPYSEGATRLFIDFEEIKN